MAEPINLDVFMTACYQAIADGAINPYYFTFGSGVDLQGSYYARGAIERFPVLAQYMERKLDAHEAFVAYQSKLESA